MDICDKYQFSPDVYFTEPILKALLKEDPALIKRIKNSCAIGYHYRRPHPAYDAIIKNAFFENKRITVKSLYYEEKVKLLREYEEKELDITEAAFISPYYCAKHTQNLGGLEYIKSIFGCPDIGAVVNTKNADLEKAEAQVQVEKGLKMLVTQHSGKTKEFGLFRKKYQAYQRPSDFGLQYNFKNCAKFEEIFRRKSKRFTYNRPRFAGILTHDYDFYKSAGWVFTPRRGKEIYLSQNEQKHMLREFEKLISSLVADKSFVFVNIKKILAMFEEAEKASTPVYVE